jgi:hypothetical protein
MEASRPRRDDQNDDRDRVYQQASTTSCGVNLPLRL